MPEMTEEQRKQLEEKIKNMSPEELKEFQKQQCVFCQIISGKIPSKKVYEDNKCIAVLDINPATKGHLLILPKEHYSIMPQIPDKDIGHLFLVSKYLSQVLLKVLKVSGTNIFVANGLVAGQRAQHFMVHLIPRKEGDKMLDIEEKLLDSGLRAKIKDLVEKRLNALLGIKKTIPETELKETKTELVVENETKPEPNEIEMSNKEEEITTKPPEEKQSIIKKKKYRKIRNVSHKTKKDTFKSKQRKKKAHSPSSKDNVSLDDVASLFR